MLADRQNMAFSGTLVAAGQANGIVVATGVHTQIGRISTLIQSVEVMATPLLTQIDQFARRFTWFVLAGGLALGLASGSVLAALYPIASRLRIS